MADITFEYNHKRTPIENAETMLHRRYSELPMHLRNSLARDIGLMIWSMKRNYNEKPWYKRLFRF